MHPSIYRGAGLDDFTSVEDGTVIDDSAPGSWAAALPYVHFPVSDYSPFERDLDRRLAARKVAHAKASRSAKLGHSTRWQRAGAKARAMFQ
jgi:hypothetical protein